MINEELREELLAMAAADRSAMTDFLAEADEYRVRFDEDGTAESGLPWP